jgi:hypothetical protein
VIVSDYELVITSCKRLEGLLEQGFGASGRGLHEKVSSVQSNLPEPLIKKLRYIATIRNRLVHDADYHALDDKPGFERASKEAERQLAAMLQPATSGKGGCMGVLAALCISAGLVVWLLVTRFA